MVNPTNGVAEEPRLLPEAGEHMDQERELRAIHDRLNELDRWAARFDGEHTERWRQQRDTNVSVGKSIRDLTTRISAIERKIAVVAGVAAASGTMVGQVLVRMFG